MGNQPDLSELKKFLYSVMAAHNKLVEEYESVSGDDEIIDSLNHHSEALDTLATEANKLIARMQDIEPNPWKK